MRLFTRRVHARRYTIFLLWIFFLGCRREQPIPQNAVWSGAVELAPNVSLPFRLQLDLSGSKPAGFFINGDERTPVPEIIRNGNDLTFRFSEYGAEMQGTWNGREWSGNYLRIRSAGTKSFKFSASPDTGATVPARVDSALAGNYQVDATTVAKLWSKDGALFGTIIAPDGDYGLLEGRSSGRGIQLSRFTGWQAILIALAPGNDGALTGTLYAAANDKPQDLVLRPRADLSVEAAANQQVVMKDPGREFEFSGLALNGETIRNTDERFKNKALVLDIMGTWCHNCLDEAPLLDRLQKQYGPNGLEVVGLSFEISGDPALARKNLQLFKDRFGLTYTLLFCGSLDDDNVNKRIHSQLDHFFAYPTSIFANKNHKVQFVHSGFKGPGTGDEFQGQIREFEDLIQKLR
jgi:thiol-disulfide isomerase/thioredoxin